MAPAQKPPPIRALSVTAATDIEIRPVHWLWEDRVALGTLCLMGGREGVGKSLITYTLAAQITRGTLPGIYFGEPKSVIVAASEDSWEHTIVPRLLGSGADLSRVFRLNVKTKDGADASLELPFDLDELRRVVTESKVALIMLDPLLSRIGHSLDTHKDADVRKALEPVVTLAHDTGASIIGLIHVNKSASSDPLTMLMGSRAFTAVARSVLFVMADPNDNTKRLLGQAKNNLGRMDQPSLSFQIIPALVATTTEGEIWTGRIEWLGDSEFTLHDAIAATSATSQDKTDKSEAMDWLTDSLEAAGGPVDSAKLKKSGKAAGHSERTLGRARDALKLTVSYAGFPRHSFWALPPNGQNGHHSDDMRFT